MVCGAGVAAEQLSVPEVAIAARVDDGFEGQVTFLEKIVNMNSDTMNFAGVHAVGAVFLAELQALGFEARWESMSDQTGRAGHVIATRNSKSGKSGVSILAIGHLDTIHPATSAFTRFSRIEDRATGPGIADMKSGDAVLLYALKALAAEGALNAARITVILTGDEEMPGSGVMISRRSMIEAAKKADVVLSFETGELGVAVTSRRGFAAWTLQVSGQRAHSSQIFSDSVGAGAIFGISRILDRFYEDLRGEPLLTFNPGVLSGGTNVDFDSEASMGKAFGKANVVAQSATTEGELRFIDQKQFDRASTRMKTLAADVLPGTKASLEIRDGYPAMPATAGNQRLLEALSGINQALGGGALRANDPLTRGAGDISFAAPYARAALDGLGAVGGGAHTDEEWLDLKDFRAATKRAAILLYRLSQQNARDMIETAPHIH
ncbi:M20/M25/M40 family metallo-hydrolase [Govanella unica]|uniref:M20/M25/M40 family metallo-hydrolase n=1 Tax=Govanella unica TaxID=2975056 RepID=A0A9X3Z7B2_9PROT|nr:M20/M25/M40 family metallo-hydrolase [Govania unica]MDA5193967.1 M20/M25/M40 family metallo-hydrolase [Govania unica]